MTRVCRYCNVDQPVSNFRWAMCRTCCNTSRRAAYSGSVERQEKAKAEAKNFYRSRGSDLRRLRLYGLTPLQFNQMAARQDFSCAICGSDESPLRVDHNHETGKVRGLLCDDCNLGIGQLKDNADTLHRAAHYVSA